MRTLVLAIALLVLVPATLFALPAKMQEGQWEITVRVEMEGVPFPMPLMTGTCGTTRLASPVRGACYVRRTYPHVHPRTA